jgi:hypothetical protein
LYLTTAYDFCEYLRHAFTTPSLAGEGWGEGDPITAELLNQNEMLCNIFVAIYFYYARKRVLCSAIALAGLSIRASTKVSVGAIQKLYVILL